MLLSVAEAAQKLQMSKFFLYRIAPHSQGFYRIGRTWRVNLEEFLESSRPNQATKEKESEVSDDD